ncbi:hypothetical protein HMPREF9176_2255 [Streptococcus downei F0415]|nr:hypothetical protein HMPREF9176_2255 [Streptococcus downei F0415]
MFKKYPPYFVGPTKKAKPDKGLDLEISYLALLIRTHR